jgi:hypothetical protein
MAWTDGSHGCLSIWAELLLALSHAAAWVIWSTKVAAGNSWANKESGYSAIGASRLSSSSAENGLVSCAELGEPAAPAFADAVPRARM